MAADTGRAGTGAGGGTLVIGVTGEVERAVYTDDAGRRWAVLVPAGRADLAHLGVVIGPPDLVAAGLVLPAGVAVRLHNELHDRGLLTAADLSRPGGYAELAAALQAALGVDVGVLRNAYLAPTRADVDGY